MIDVPRKEIICLDSQIEKINHLKPTFNVIMGRFQTVLSEGIHLSPSLSLSRTLSLSAAARMRWSCLFLGDCSCVHVTNLTLGCCSRNTLCFRNEESQRLSCWAAFWRRWGVQTLI